MLGVGGWRAPETRSEWHLLSDSKMESDWSDAGSFATERSFEVQDLSPPPSPEVVLKYIRNVQFPLLSHQPNAKKTPCIFVLILIDLSLWYKCTTWRKTSLNNQHDQQPNQMKIRFLHNLHSFLSFSLVHLYGLYIVVYTMAAVSIISVFSLESHRAI